MHVHGTLVRCGGVRGRRPSVEDVRRAFEGPAPPEPSRVDAPPGVSAVMALVHESTQGASLVLTRRSSRLRNHAGEISFPGGRIDATDETPLAAALRETHEEIGVVPDDIRVLGHLTDFLTYRNVLVIAYVGELLRAPPEKPASIEEVDEVLSVPFAQLMDAERYEARRAAGSDPSWRVHYWHLPRCTLWGITGELTARLLRRAWGWAPPSEARIITSIDEFAPARRP